MKKFPVLRLIITMMSKMLKSVVLNIISAGGQQLRTKRYSDAAALFYRPTEHLSEVLMLVGS
jgi:hypothetical protein